MVPKFVAAKMLGTTGWGEGKFKVQGSKFSAARPEKNGNDGKRLRTDGNRRMNRLNHEGGKGVFRV